MNVAPCLAEVVHFPSQEDEPRKYEIAEEPEAVATVMEYKAGGFGG